MQHRNRKTLRGSPSPKGCCARLREAFHPAPLPLHFSHCETPFTWTGGYLSSEGEVKAEGQHAGRSKQQAGNEIEERSTVRRFGCSEGLMKRAGSTIQVAASSGQGARTSDQLSAFSPQPEGICRDTPQAAGSPVCRPAQQALRSNLTSASTSATRPAWPGKCAAMRHWGISSLTPARV